MDELVMKPEQMFQIEKIPEFSEQEECTILGGRTRVVLRLTDKVEVRFADGRRLPLPLLGIKRFKDDLEVVDSDVECGLRFPSFEPQDGCEVWRTGEGV